MDKHQLINSIIIDLNDLTVKGAENMAIVMRAINNLSALSNGLKEETERYQKRIQELEQEVKAHEETDATQRTGA